MAAKNALSIWFFVGICLLVDGVLILGAGIYQVFRPPIHPVVLYALHANVWWGALLALVGLYFFAWHAPWRHRKRR